MGKCSTQRGLSRTLANVVFKVSTGLMMSGPLAAGVAFADAPNADASGNEVVVVGKENKAVLLAPSQASISATEPQSIITQDFIEKSLPRGSDFNAILLITPSAGGNASPNGPGLGESKTTLRGFKDGEYNITFDGIPEGDTNGPSHHSTSFFPSSDIGSVTVERGPGNPSNLGQATFGGTVMLFSRPLSDTFGGYIDGSIGTWSSTNLVANIQSGALLGDHKAHGMAVFHHIQSDGAQSFSPVHGDDQMLKGDISFLGDRLHITGLLTHDYNEYFTPDSTSGLTATRTVLLGKDYQFSDDPTRSDFYGYYQVKKQTWFTYLKADYKLTDNITISDQPYSYWYDNETISASDATYKDDNITPSTAFSVKFSDGGASVRGIPGYDKLNKFSVYGNILRTDISFGDIGKLTAGLWSEYASTDRHQFALDVVTRRPIFSINSTTVPQADGSGKVYGKDITYLQHSNWTQNQVFAEFAWTPVQKLTLTPGVKYITYVQRVDAPVNQTSRGEAHTDKSFESTLPYFTANYRIMDNWSVYAQYAKGWLAPNINSTYVAKANNQSFDPQTSTNYQVGTVFRTNHLTIDVDYYDIPFKNKVQCFGAGANPFGTVLTDAACFNIGGAEYEGFEGQATYAFDNGLAVFANGSQNDATVSNDPVPANNGKQISGAPLYTYAAGVIFSNGPFRASLVHKVTGVSYASANEVNKIEQQPSTNLNASVTIGRAELYGSINNLFDSQEITSISGSGANARFGYQSGQFIQFGVKVSY